MEGESTGCLVECRLESAHDLAALISALQLREKDQKDQRVYCEASSRGLKFSTQSGGKDVAVLGWMFRSAFKEYQFTGDDQEIHLKLPVAPLLHCLQIFSDRAALVLRYPLGPSDELRFTLEEEGAVTECCLKTLVLDETPIPISSFFATGDPLCVLRPTLAETWHQALSEFAELEAPDVVLRVTLRAGEAASTAAMVLRAQTISTVSSDAEVELPSTAFEEVTLSPNVIRAGEVTHSYLLTSVLTSCMRAAKDAKAVKIRFNCDGQMSNQFILRSRGQTDLFCEALVSPLANTSASYMASTSPTQSAAARDSVGF